MNGFTAKKAVPYIFAIVLAMALSVIATPPGRTAFLTLSFLPEVLPNAPIRPLTWVTKDPVRQAVRYSNGPSFGEADLYLPGEGSNHGAILLFLGVNPAGRDDSRVVDLGNALARSGVVTMIPWSDTMTQNRIDPDEIDNLVNAYQYLLQHDRVDPERAGMAGFCVGASLAMVAAQDVLIRDDVRFINFFGGYYSGADLIAAVTTGTRFYHEETQPWVPNDLTRAVVTAQLIESIANASERTILAESSSTAGLPEPIVESLGRDSRAVYELLSGPNILDVPDLIEGLPVRTLADIERISPSTRILDLQAKVFIMHDREDTLVPSEESRRLADSLESEQIGRYTEFAFFRHVDPTRPVSRITFLKEAGKLYWHLYGLFRELS